MKKIICLAVMLMLAVSLMPKSVSAAGSNLALGKSYTVETAASDDRSYSEMQSCTDTVLTDGERGDTDYGSPKWGKFYRAVARTITVDLGAACTVSEIKTCFLQNASAGIIAPQSIKIFASSDGVNFCEAEVKSGGNPPYPASYSFDPSVIAEYDIVIKSVSARYIALYFDVTVNTFCDEIEIYGTVGSSLEPPTDFVTVGGDTHDELCARDALGGDHDIICFHAGYYPDDETLVNNTVNSFLSYIGYYDGEHRISDTMFDSVMFLTLQGKCPSGGSLCIDGGTTVMSDWVTLLDNYFSEEYNLSALDEATRQLKETLSLDKSHTTSVYLTIPFPKISDADFGDYDGDGKSDRIGSTDDCIKVMRWFIDEINARWEKAGYENLTLKGYFYFSEAISDTYYDYESELAAKAVSLIHEYGLYSVMIPFYQASGIDKVYDIGFDAALMQPNLSFNAALQDDPEGMMEDFRETAEKYGLGIQMEIADGFRWEPEKFGVYYLQYLISASKNGLMTDTIHAYYNGAGPGVFYDISRSQNAYSRWFYDATYKFIKGTLDLPEEARVSGADTEFTVTGREKAVGKTGAQGDWYYTYEFTLNPADGYCILSGGSDSFIYSADRNFSGTDTFSYNILLNGEVIGSNTVTVTVLAEEGSESASEAGSEAELVPADRDLRTVRIVAYAVGAVIAAVLLFLLFRSKKNKTDIRAENTAESAETDDDRNEEGKNDR